MCGFVVTTRKNDVEYMTMRQKHRGPSDHAFWKDITLRLGMYY